MKNKLNTNYMQNLTQKSNNKGFTITELLIAIAIVGVMPAIIMPLFLEHYDFPPEQITSNN